MLIQSLSYATSTSGLQNEKDGLKDKISDAQDQQQQVQQELNNQMKEISSLDAKITENEEQINLLTAQIEVLETSIAAKTLEIEKKQQEYEENEELLSERLVIMYESGDSSFLDLLFGSSNIVEFLSNYYTLSQLTQCDVELLEEIEQERKEIEQAKNELEQQKTQLDSSKNEKSAISNTLKNQKTERQQKANQLSAEEKALQSEIDDYNAEVKKVEQQIQEILKKEQERQEAEKNNGNSSGGSSGSQGLKFDGSFVWPCNNKVVTSTVKIRWGKWHKGIDIGASYENVYASASGYAYTLENPGGYGHYIMIVHGDGYITLYGHLNSYKISSGQYVSQGQVIAQSGNSGASFGAHLHFEIRKATSISNYFSSTYLNPLEYLPGGYTLAPGATTPS